MKDLFDWTIILGIILITLTSVFYYIHFLIFRDPHHIFIYFLGDVAFVFFEVLLVTLVIHRLLHHREQKAMACKLNMLIGAFFSEAGTELLRKFSAFDMESSDLSAKLAVPVDWSEKEFLDLHESVHKHIYSIEHLDRNLEPIKTYLLDKKPLLLDLIQNPCLLENESFTNLIWAVFHLTQELIHRQDLHNLSRSDCLHLAEDIKRVYKLLIIEWIHYIKHLKMNYPYLFSLAERTNPFKQIASVEVK